MKVTPRTFTGDIQRTGANVRKNSEGGSEHKERYRVYHRGLCHGHAVEDAISDSMMKKARCIWQTGGAVWKVYMCGVLHMQGRSL